MMDTEKIGLFFGSFNPITLSHLYVARVVYEETDIEQVWFVLSPQNPEKDDKDLLDFSYREQMIRDAFLDFQPGDDIFRFEGVENELPKPSYTYRTLEKLRKRDAYVKANEYVIIMGDDTYNNIKNWKNIEKLYGEEIMVVPRIHPAGNTTNKIKLIELREDEDIVLNECENPLTNVLNISSTIVRDRIKKNKKVNGLVTPSVAQKIHEKRFYI